MKLLGTIVIKNPKFEGAECESIEIKLENQFSVFEAKGMVDAILDTAEKAINCLGNTYKAFLKKDLEVVSAEKEHEEKRNASVPGEAFREALNRGI